MPSAASASTRPRKYAQYARSVVANETAAAVGNRKEIVYWGTRHLGDPATNLSSALLIEPLANGLPGAVGGTLKEPIHAKVGYARNCSVETRWSATHCSAHCIPKSRPRCCFTASHGMAIQSGKPRPSYGRWAALPQDWPGYGSVKPEHVLTAANVADDANVSGLVAFLFACSAAAHRTPTSS